jgi:hypothetical protein
MHSLVEKIIGMGIVAVALGVGSVACGGGEATTPTHGDLASRGALVHTVVASAETTSEQGVARWEIFQRDGAYTTYGVDASGRVLTLFEIEVRGGAGAREITLTTPESQLRIDGSGRVLSGSAGAPHGAVTRMAADLRNAKGTPTEYAVCIESLVNMVLLCGSGLGDPISLTLCALAVGDFLACASG